MMATAQFPVYYSIHFADLSGHYLDISVDFTPTQPCHQLSLPAWIPGSYMIRDFARHLIAITAVDSQGPLLIQQSDKQNWQLQCRGLAVTVRYRLYAFDTSVRAAYLDDEIAVLNPACLCLAVSDLQQQIHHLRVHAPRQQTANSWRLATALTRAADTEFLGFGDYQARDYQQLIDSPLLAGHFSLSQFSVNGVEHYLVLSGDNLTDQQRITADVASLCQQQAAVFDGLPDDLSAYWFLVWVTEQGFGGLEHQQSTLLLCSRFDLPAPGLAVPDDAYQQFLALCSHEYFHLWWVTRLKPACFSPFQLQQEQYSKQLWLYEGFTSYYDELALARSGLISEAQYLTLLEKTISRVTRNPSEQVQSLAESSFTAWTKFYKQDENAINAVVSYYAKGALVAFCLDAALRQQGSNLDKLCRYLYQHYLASGTFDDSIYLALQQLGFADLARQLQGWVETTAPLPLAAASEQLGLSLTWRQAQHQDDVCGQAAGEDMAQLGAIVTEQAGLLKVKQVLNGSAAHQAGLMAGDQLLALAGFKLSSASLSQLLRRLAIGTVQPLVIFRKDRLLELKLPVAYGPAHVAMLQVQQPMLNRPWHSLVSIATLS
ncbi:M61 family metallopeptidase [Arsukibacterium sp.]|uniref:M61 family metallopeptidase n=1 Tax=Arsukibacterium sp. TaxID=1977258 RepID=UPI002FD9CC47